MVAICPAPVSKVAMKQSDLNSMFLLEPDRFQADTEFDSDSHSPELFGIPFDSC